MKRNFTYFALVVCLVAFLTSCYMAIRDKKYDEAAAWGCCAVLECVIIGLLSYGFNMKDQYDGVCENRDEFASIAKEAVSNSEEALRQCGELIDEERDLIEAIGVLQEYIDEGLYQEINEKLQGKSVLFSDKFTPGEMSLCYRVKK
jgi:hypothetical protein